MKKIFGIITIFIICILAIANCSFAAEEIEMKLEADKSVIKPGEEMKVALSVKNGLATELQGLGGIIKFNDDVFELVTIDYDTALEEISMPAILEELDKQMKEEGQNYKIVDIYEDYLIMVIEQGGAYGFAMIFGLDPIATSSTYKNIGEITFKVKSSASNSTEKISLTNMMTTSESDAESVQIENVSTQEISINKGENDDIEDIPSLDDGGDEDIVADEEDENNDSKNPTTPTNTNPQTANTDAPDAGIEDVIPFIVIAAILGFIGYAKYSKYQGI